VNEAINKAKAALDQEVKRAQVTDDPLGHHLVALQATVEALHQVAVGTTDAVARQLDAARQPISPQALDQLSKSAANGATRYAAEIAKSTNRRTVALLALAGVALLVVGAGAGALVGWREGARSAPPYASMTADEASAWGTLITANAGGGPTILSSCEKAAKVVEGRRACATGLWLEPPRPQPLAVR
jgi:hypothetical protein